MSEKSLTVVKPSDEDEYLPLDSRPAHLPTVAQENMGMGNLDKDDYKTPRIILLQGLSPELELHPGVALKDNFWHTGMNISLGKEFIFVPCLVNKRVILFRPRGDQGGGILAFSKDGKNWDTGGDKTFSVKLKGKKEPVKWATGKNVLSSRLCDFGSSDPDFDNSAPAATTIYEYLAYLPKHPELSPCVISVSKTGLPNGKSFNTSLALLTRSGTPTFGIAVKCSTEDMHNDDGNWTVPSFNPVGKVKKETYDICKEYSDKYSDYNVEYQDEAPATDIEDGIEY